MYSAMKKYIETISLDDSIKIEFFSFDDIIQSFSNHFHNYYVIGLIKAGERFLICNNRNYLIRPGCIILLNPMDSHSCMQKKNFSLKYCSINIDKTAMCKLMGKIVSKNVLPVFNENVIYNRLLFELFDVISNKQNAGRERNVLLFISAIIKKYAAFSSWRANIKSEEIDNACKFLKKNFHKKILLDEICKLSNTSKSTLLRLFTDKKYITPHKYLESVRLIKAKQLLANGYFPIDVANKTGFADQSHFTNRFNAIYGITPTAYQKMLKARIINNEKE